MSTWVVLTAIWTIFTLKTFYLLPSHQQGAFLSLSAMLFLFFLLIGILSREKKVGPKLPQDRLSILYQEILKAHHKQLKKLRLYYSLMVGALLAGWTIFLVVEFFSLSLFQGPEMITLYLSLSCLLGILGLERSHLVDCSLVENTLKGIRVEKKIAREGFHTFSRIIRRRQGVLLLLYSLLRMAPILLIVFHLFKYGFYPVVKIHFSSINFIPNIFFEGAPLLLILVGLTKFVITPYRRLVKKTDRYYDTCNAK